MMRTTIRVLVCGAGLAVIAAAHVLVAIGIAYGNG